MRPSFSEKLASACQQSSIVLCLAPKVAQMPLSIQRYDDPFLPFGREVIRATQDLVCGYLFDLAAYFALGAAGMIALERTIPLVDTRLVRILHGPFYGSAYADGAFESAFGCDAVTLVNDVHLGDYLREPQHSAFVMQEGLPRTDHIHGVYWHDFRLLTYPTAEDQVLNLHLADEKVLYASRGEDFTDSIRAALEKMLNEHTR